MSLGPAEKPGLTRDVPRPPSWVIGAAAVPNRHVTADSFHVDNARNPGAVPPPSSEQLQDLSVESDVDVMNATVVIGPVAVGHGRHAAPPSAYGPTDVHRLHPAPRVGAGGVQSKDAESQLVDYSARAIPAAVDVTTSGGCDSAGSSEEASAKSTGFWARLRHLSKAV